MEAYYASIYGIIMLSFIVVLGGAPRLPSYVLIIPVLFFIIHIIMIVIHAIYAFYKSVEGIETVFNARRSHCFLGCVL
jgi:hypothetical protein